MRYLNSFGVWNRWLNVLDFCVWFFLSVLMNLVVSCWGRFCWFCVCIVFVFCCVLMLVLLRLWWWLVISLLLFLFVFFIRLLDSSWGFIVRLVVDY